MKLTASPIAGRHPLLTYFLEGVGTGLVKIGESTNLDNRIQQLQSTSPAQLQLIGITPFAESLLHYKFRAKRHHQEWFHLDDELQTFIDQECSIEKFLRQRLGTLNEKQARLLEGLKRLADQGSLNVLTRFAEIQAMLGPDVLPNVATLGVNWSRLTPHLFVDGYATEKRGRWKEPATWAVRRAA